MENDVYKIALTVVLTAMGGMVTWYLKNISTSVKMAIKELVDDLKKVKEEQADITYNYVSKFNETHKAIYELSASFSNHTDKIAHHFEDKVEELKVMFEKHFLEKHGNVVSDVAKLEEKIMNLEKQLVESIRHMNDGALEFYQKHQSALDWIEEKRKEEQEQLKRKKSRLNV